MVDIKVNCFYFVNLHIKSSKIYSFMIHLMVVLFVFSQRIGSCCFVTTNIAFE